MAAMCQRRVTIRQVRRVKIRQIDEGTSLRSSRPPDGRGAYVRARIRALEAHGASPRARVLAHAVTVAADRDQVTVVDEAIDEGGGHDLIAEDFSHSSKPLFDVSTVDACS